MKQIIQDLSSGETKLIEVPIPSIGPNEILIKSSKSLISKGTEKMLIDFGQSNWINRIRQQPEKVKDVLGKAKLDGISSAYGAVTSKLNQPVILGYSNVGKVIESNVNGFSKGDRVISNGPHSEIILSTKNLCAKIPDNIDDESASFTVVGSIALQGIRLANPSIGENFVVIGLGLIGLLTVQILKANGCKVLGIDLDSKKCEKAKNFGAEVIDLSKNNEIISRAKNFSNGMGVDGVIITANTKSNDPVTQAAKICRKKARIILVGVTGLQLNRQDFYEKELTFQVSCSYGPGRYDDFYELEGHDYPIGHVRWTENRNFEAFLDLLSNKYIDVKSLISDSFSIDKSIEAYKLLEDNSSLGILLEYPYDDEDVN